MAGTAQVDTAGSVLSESIPPQGFALCLSLWSGCGPLEDNSGPVSRISGALRDILG